MDQTQSTESTHTSNDLSKDGLESPRNFLSEWNQAIQPGDDSAISRLIERAISVLCPELPCWEVRLANNVDREEWETYDALTDVTYGTSVQFLFNPTCGAGTRDPLRYLASSVIHEVLHVTFYPVEHAVSRSFDDDDNLGDVLDGAIHQLIDTLAWRLVDKVFPELFPNPQEEDEDVDDQVSEESCTDDCGDVRVDHDCSCAG